MGRKSRRQNAGRFLLSRSKIAEFTKLNITPDSVEHDPRYHKDIVDFIIANSTIEKISKIDTDKSRYGILYKLTLNSDVESPLVNLKLPEKRSLSGRDPVSTEYYKPVKTFLLKLSFLSLADEIHISTRTGKTSVLMTDFVKEAKVQNTAYDSTYQLGESVVPACIAPAYYDFFEKKGAINMTFAKLLIPEVDTDGYLEHLSLVAKSKNVAQFGLLLMEYAEGFKTLEEILDDKSLNKDDRIRAKMLAKLSHLLLFQNGIVQGDSHDQNVMVNLDYEGFLSEVSGKALVIDFGRAQKVPADVLQRKHDYTKIMDLINLVSNPVGEQLPQFDWLKIAEPLEITYLNLLIESRQERFDLLKSNIIAFFPKRTALVSDLIERFNIGSLNRLRWAQTRKAPQTPPSKRFSN